MTSEIHVVADVIKYSKLSVENETSIHSLDLDIRKVSPLTNYDTSDTTESNQQEKTGMLDEKSDEDDDALHRDSEDTDTDDDYFKNEMQVVDAMHRDSEDADTDDEYFKNEMQVVADIGMKKSGAGMQVTSVDITYDHIKVEPRSPREYNASMDSSIPGLKDGVHLREEINVYKDCASGVKEINLQQIKKMLLAENDEGELIDGLVDTRTNLNDSGGPVGNRTDMNNSEDMPDVHNGVSFKIVTNEELGQHEQHCLVTDSNVMTYTDSFKNGMQVITDSEKNSDAGIQVADVESTYVKLEPMSPRECDASIDSSIAGLRDCFHQSHEAGALSTGTTIRDKEACSNDCTNVEESEDRHTPESTDRTGRIPHGQSSSVIEEPTGTAELPNMLNQVSCSKSNLNQSMEEPSLQQVVKDKQDTVMICCANGSSGEGLPNNMIQNSPMSELTRQSVPPANEACFTDAWLYRRTEVRESSDQVVNASHQSDLLSSKGNNSQPSSTSKLSVDFVYAPSAGEKLIWEEQIIQCPVCSVEKDSTKEVMSHMREHHSGETPFRCCHCMFSSMNIQTMVDHINRLHPGSLFDLCHFFHMCQWQTVGSNGATPCNPSAYGKRACRPLNSDAEFYHCSSCGFKSFQLPLMVDHIQRSHKKCSYLEIDPSTQQVVCPVCLHHWDHVQIALSHTCSVAGRNTSFAYEESQELRAGHSRNSGDGGFNTVWNPAQSTVTTPYQSSLSSHTLSRQEAFHGIQSSRKYKSSVDLRILPTSPEYNTNPSPCVKPDTVSPGYRMVYNRDRYPSEIQESRFSQYHLENHPTQYSNESQSNIPAGHPSMADPTRFLQEDQRSTSTGHPSVADPTRYLREVQETRPSQFSMLDMRSQHCNKCQRSTSTGHPSVADHTRYPRASRESRSSQYSMLDVRSHHTNEGQRRTSRGYLPVVRFSPYSSGRDHQGLHPFHHMPPQWTGRREALYQQQFEHGPDIVSSRTEQARNPVAGITSQNALLNETCAQEQYSVQSDAQERNGVPRYVQHESDIFRPGDSITNDSNRPTSKPSISSVSADDGGHVENATDDEMDTGQKQVLPVIISVTSLNTSWRKDFSGGCGSREK
ncbi:uncharacterized protein [Amphiura filiformis]|uniref:uncharacterized protein n=1 Tax=Amphiura filiformis TaxID=82378 RepID=UPI003B2118D8